MRLALALPDAPAGRVAAFAPRAGDDLAALGPACEVVSAFRPDIEAFSARGLATRRGPEGRYGLSLVCLPRARAAGRDLVAQALAVTDGAVLVDGQKTDGIEAMLRDCRARVPVSEPVSRAHGKLFVLDGADAPAFADWRAAPRRLPSGFITRPGVFSADGPDPGSVLLAGALPPRLPGRVADLGAGWGWLSAQLLARSSVESLHLVEADADALDCARANIGDPRACFHWADVTRFVPPAPLDAVVTNPPFHVGRAGAPGLGAAFIAAAARMLAPHGVLWLVANRHLPYETVLAQAFRKTVELPGSAGFKLFRAEAPRAAPDAGRMSASVRRRSRA